MDIGLTRRDIYRFIKIYSGKTLRETLQSDKSFWQNVKTTAEKLYFKEFRRNAPEF
jgi:hypothetical protein